MGAGTKQVSTTESPEFQQAKTQVLDALASSGADPGPASPPGRPASRSGGLAASVAPEGATPEPSPDASPAILSGDPAPITAPATAPATLAGPERHTNGSGVTSLEVIPANEPLEKWGTGGGVQWLAEYERMARLIAGTVTLPDALKSPRDILAVALTGRELGIGFMESTRLIHIIHGTPALAAELKVKLARRAGHDIRILGESAGTISVWCVTHESDQSVFTIEDAKRAKLVKPNGGWDTYPADLLWARAVTRLIRRHCPEVVGASMRSVEELSGD